MKLPDSLPDRLFLLAYDVHRQRMSRCQELGYVLRAAALAELYLNGHLTEESGKPRVFVREPGPGPVLEDVLRQVAESRPRSWTHWVRKGSRGMVGAVRGHLAADGWIRVEPRRRLGIFPGHTVTVRDPRVVTQLNRRATTALREGRSPANVDPRDAATVALAAGGGLRTVLDGRERRRNKDRIKDLGEVGGPAAAALRKAIQRKRAATAAAASSGAAGS
ncbi:MAG: hypothetical protein JWO67_5546 [Streptosporangiaceae bacterium]|jgi:hypothetical protein|nr:hypothetical protein [Streptosporangiaceae bacterium]